MQITTGTTKLGILGGGQLGRMLLQQAANYPVETHVLENDADCPAAHLCHYFVKGDIKDFETVYNFGKALNVITIEIENVNIDALEQLETEGVNIVPSTTALRIIKNKIHQKQFYQQNEIPSSDFVIVHNKQELLQNKKWLPAVQKSGEGGYDGKGVQVIATEKDIELGFDEPSVLEKMVNIEKEIAVIVAVAQNGSTALYPPVQMVFDPYLNLLDYQFCPADITENVLWKVEAIALKVARSLQSAGLFAIELFVSKQGDVLVNETAPRVHNSGHHTIEAHYCSQYDMLLRILLNYPLGNAAVKMPSSLVNIIGEADNEGVVVYEGLEDVLKMENTYVHLYGKKQTRPGRKMGHVTILAKDKIDTVRKAHEVKQLLKAVEANI
jgi:5-(carboxyamino)imidazole ribonucleotide synthase